MQSIHVHKRERERTVKYHCIEVTTINKMISVNSDCLCNFLNWFLQGSFNGVVGLTLKKEKDCIGFRVLLNEYIII